MISFQLFLCFKFDISFKYEMLCVSYNYKLKDSIPKFSRVELIFGLEKC